MLKHSLLISIRSFRRNKLSFFINVLGLSTSLASVILIFLWINDEQSIDAFHKNNDSLYQVMTNFEWQNKITTMENNPLLLADALTKEFPEVEAATSIGADFIELEGVLESSISKKVGKGIFASENFFDTFSFNLIYGNKAQVLLEKENIVISESFAKALFINPEKAVGKTLIWDYNWSDGGKKRTLLVSGVFEDTQQNSTLQFDALLSSKLMTDESRWAGEWSGGYANTYVILTKNTNIENFNKKIKDFWSSKLKDNYSFTLFAQKFDARYLKGNYENGVETGGRIVYVKLFALIAVFILIIACINFMNLSTARASRRMKEIGVKKVVGGNRKSLIVQFLLESIFIAAFSAILSLLFVMLILPQFNQITGKEIQLFFGFNIFIAICTLVLITGFLSGFYPAFYLSRFKPVSILKGKTKSIAGEVWVRKGLVVFQFTLSIIFIVSVFIINSQMNFLMDKNLGYNRNNIITFKMKTNFSSREAMLNELKAIPTVDKIAYMSGSLLSGTDSQGGYSWRGIENDKKIMFQSPRIGYNFIETMGIDITQGRSFSKEFKDDHSKIMINEAAVALMNLENPIGTIIDHGNEKKEIIGVVKNFHYGSLHKKMEPLILRFRNGGADIVLRLKSQNISTSLQKIEQIFLKFQPNYAFNFSFLDTQYQKLYDAERRIAILSKIFAVLAIIISCLGLFGLVTFTAQQRAKEIGVRKILGASVAIIIKMLSKDFLKLIGISIIIAIPISWLAMHNWLLDFAYRIEIKWWFFIVAGCVAISISMITVGIQAFKVAILNPIHSLKTE